MRDLFIFAIGASITATIFFISLFELLFTIKRRKAYEALQSEIKGIQKSYITTLAQKVAEEDAKVAEAEGHLEAVTEQATEDKTTLEKTYQEKIDEITHKSEHALELAQAKAKKLEQAAKLKAAEYMKTRQQEVEEDLMNLVISVTKKVLPQGLSYEIQKDLVMQALREVKSESSE